MSMLRLTLDLILRLASSGEAKHAERLLQELRALVQTTNAPWLPEDVVYAVEAMPILWSEATPDERVRIQSALISLVLEWQARIDVRESKRAIAGLFAIFDELQPMPSMELVRVLLQCPASAVATLLLQQSHFGEQEVPSDWVLSGYNSLVARHGAGTACDFEPVLNELFKDTGSSPVNRVRISGSILLAGLGANRKEVARNFAEKWVDLARKLNSTDLKEALVPWDRSAHQFQIRTNRAAFSIFLMGWFLGITDEALSGKRTSQTLALNKSLDRLCTNEKRMNKAFSAVFDALESNAGRLQKHGISISDVADYLRSPKANLEDPGPRDLLQLANHAFEHCDTSDPFSPAVDSNRFGEPVFKDETAPTYDRPFEMAAT